MAYSVFISYAHEDKGFLIGLHTHLANLQKRGLISRWYDGDIVPGTEWEKQIMNHLDTDQIILLLISADFMASDFCYGTELRRAMERHRAEQARVVPILIRPTDWEGAPFSKLNILPSNNKAVSSWSNRDEAFEDVVKGIKTIIEDLQTKNTANNPLTPTTMKDVEHPDHPLLQPQPQPSWPAPPPQLPVVDILLVTATIVEAKAVLKLAPGATLLHLGEQTYHDLGTIGQARTFMVQSEMGTGDPGGATLVIEEAIRVLNPWSVIMVGIAFGVDPEEQKIGDILISKQLVQYEIQKVGTNKEDQQQKIILRGDRPSASPRLLSRFRAFANYWDGPPDVSFGIILTGAKLVDNQDFRDQLLNLASGEAIGGEMEAGGLYAPAQRKKVDWIVVKAICDWADGNKSVDKRERQRSAAENAVRFTLEVLKSGGFTRYQPPPNPR